MSRSDGSTGLSITPCTPVTHTYCGARVAIHRSIVANASAIVMALTPTPSTLTRGGASGSTTDTPCRSLSSTALRGIGRRRCRGTSQGAGHVLLDPRIGKSEALLEGNLWFPTKDLAQPGIVGVPPAHPLRTRHMFLDDGNAGYTGDEIGKVVDRDETVLPKIQRFVIIGAHQPEDALDAIVDITKRARLLTVTPDLDLVVARQLRDGDLAAQGRRCLLATTVPRAQRPEDVVEAHGSRFDAVVVAVVSAEPFGDEFLPPICILWCRRIRVFLAQRFDVRVELAIFGIHTG